MRLAYSARIPAAWMIGRQRAISLEIRSMNICGGPGVTSTPRDCRLARVVGSARALLSAAFSLATAAYGVPAGAMILYQALASMPGSPASA